MDKHNRLAIEEHERKKRIERNKVSRKEYERRQAKRKKIEELQERHSKMRKSLEEMHNYQPPLTEPKECAMCGSDIESIELNKISHTFHANNGASNEIIGEVMLFWKECPHCGFLDLRQV